MYILSKNMFLSRLFHSNSLKISKIIRNKISLTCNYSSKTSINNEILGYNGYNKDTNSLKLFNNEYKLDEWTNLNKSILSKLNRNLHKQQYHPLNHLCNQIKSYFYKNYVNRAGNATFSIFDNIQPVVTVEQNFDSLLVPKNHVSRSNKDCYYVNKGHLLRAHTSAHQFELIKSGLNSFLVIGDVYRRDEVNATHYPIFHQCEGVRLFNKHELFKSNSDDLELFERAENQTRLTNKQETHTLEATKLVEHDLKHCLSNLVCHLFGSSKLNMKWVETTFPFTHPSWELEIEFNNKWYEVLGCGIIEQKILTNAGAHDCVGWAFGLGLERWAMILYDIPDIRVFWSTDNGFLSQFKYDDSSKITKYKPVSVYPPCTNNISFWLPEDAESIEKYHSNAFYDVVREVGGDLVEQVELVDEFKNAKTNRTSHCYKITYRSVDRTLKQSEVNVIHKQIENKSTEKFNVKIR